MQSDKAIFNRVSLLVGHEAMERIRGARVIVFGVGGVGSWCVESLVRSGIMHVTIVDGDLVSATNVNRQLMATTMTVGEPKVEALRRRLLEINPCCEVTAIQRRFNEETADTFSMSSYDYIIDAIDVLKDKALLIMRACDTGAVFFSSMGAALKIDPTRVRTAEFWKVRGCTLGAALRKKMKRAGMKPARKFTCVYSEEMLDNRGMSDEDPGEKAVVNGTLAHITGIFGLTIAGLVMQDICARGCPDGTQEPHDDAGEPHGRA